MKTCVEAVLATYIVAGGMPDVVQPYVTTRLMLEKSNTTTETFLELFQTGHIQKSSGMYGKEKQSKAIFDRIAFAVR